MLRIIIFAVALLPRYSISEADEIRLRESVLWRRLGKLVDDLIINLQPEEEEDCWGNKYKPFNGESHAIWWAIGVAIRASHLNTLNPAESIRNRFDGKLKRQKNCLQEFTSLSLFRDDVERLLRDLYGDITARRWTKFCAPYSVSFKSSHVMCVRLFGKSTKMQWLGITYAGSACSRDTEFLVPSGDAE